MRNPRDRLEYSAIIDRPPLRLPGGARLVVWPIVNVEVWDISRPMARQVMPAPSGVPVVPDFPNWSWHEYGMRVGFWRLKAALDRFGVTPTLSINAAVCLDYPRVAAAARDAGWEFMAHGLKQMPMHQLDDQEAVIARTMAILEGFTGKRPRGWLGPGLTQTYETVDYLAGAGVQYIGDWVLDDQPCTLATAHGPLVALPYTVEQNDIAVMVVQHHRADELLRRTRDAFDRLYQEGRETARVLAVAVHPYISGVPHRIIYVEQLFEYLRGHEGVLFWTGEQILDWFVAQDRRP